MNRKHLLVVAALAAGILSINSIAWACITFVGDMQVRSTRASSDSDWVTGRGGTTSMQYCSGGAGGVTNAADATIGTHTITVEVKPASGCNTSGTNKFGATTPATLHEIWVNKDGGTSGAYTGSDGSWTWVANSGCWATTPPSELKVGTLSVDANGNGTTSGISLSGLTPNDTGEASVVCAGGGAEKTGFGNFNPLVLL